MLSSVLVAVFTGCTAARRSTVHGLAGRMSYYSTQSETTAPGKYVGLYAQLPDDVRGMCEALHGTCIHVFHAGRYGVSLDEAHRNQTRVSRVEDILEVIYGRDRRPLVVPREPERRFVANCRQYAVLLCSMLRNKGVAARVRCGFATYFPGMVRMDHWICEYWNAVDGRWIMVDPQLDVVQVDEMDISVDPLDLPPGAFLTAGEAWRRCRERIDDPNRYGIGEIYGMWFIRDNVVRDFMALNKREVMPWDCVGFMGKRTTSDASRDLTDRLADLSLHPDTRFRRLRAVFSSNPLFREE